MPLIFPAQRPDRQGGFTLIEVMVALAITAMTISAAVAAVSASQKLGNSAGFQLKASHMASRIQGEYYGLIKPDERDTGLKISPMNPDARDRWIVYRIIADNRELSIAFSVPPDTTQ